MIVLDASAVFDVLVRREPMAGWAETIIGSEAEGLCAPHLIDTEVVATLRRAAARRGADEAALEVALGDFLELEIRRFPHTPFLERAWELRQNVTIADGIYLALAEALQVPLVTTDTGLARVPNHRAEVLAWGPSTG